LKRKELLQA